MTTLWDRHLVAVRGRPAVRQRLDQGELTVMLQMYGAGLAFLVIAVVAALFGFGVVSDDDPLAAKVCAGFFLFAAVAAFGWAWLNRSQTGTRPAPRRFSVSPNDQRITAAKPAAQE